MRFRSKIDWWFYLVVVLVLTATVMVLLTGGTVSTAKLLVWGLFLLIDALLVFPVFLCTHYTLEEEALHIRSGLCVNMRIHYADILSVDEARGNVQASPALSNDRLRIGYYVDGREQGILVSPKDKQLFLTELHRRIQN